MMNILVVLSAVLCLSAADFSLDRSYDNLVDLARLYRMQNLDEFQLARDDIDSRSGANWVAPYGDAMYKDPQFGGTHLRDQEHIEQSSLYGAQAISGGSNGNKPKPNKPLPAYCNPPNPCPIGYNARDNNCVEEFTNSAEHNRELMAKQDCPCDTEHMFECPEGRGTVSSKSQGDSAAIKQVMEELSNLGEGSNNPYLGESKRESLVAKKSPEYSTIKRSTGEKVHYNPQFRGELKRVASKKSPQDWSHYQ